MYSENVENLCYLNSYSTCIIYKDYKVEYYTFSQVENKSVSYYKKVISQDGFLAELTHDNYLLITSDTDSTMHSSDNIVLITFEDVDDIEYENDVDAGMEYLIIKSKNGQVKLITHTPIYDF